jgi:undecaprenyl-phosphate 4-deoxy-4-formamido-L-arabinose transferase
MKISICIPVYNGADSIGRLVEKVQQQLAGYELEFVLVNDGSPDNSDEVCSDLARRMSNVTYVCLRKNSGEHNAVMCGLNHVTGDYVAIIDDDFQNPPEEILTLIDEAKRGNFDVVYSKYKKKMHAAHRNLGSKFNDLVATWLLEKPRDLYLSSFKLIHIDVVHEIIKYKGPFPYIDGLILRVTRNIGSVYVRHEDRKAGRSNYTLKKLFSLWLNMFINFSVKPLRLFTTIGIATSLLSLLLLVWFVVEKILRPDQQQGWTSIMCAVTFFAGVQLMFLGLIGEYLGKQYLTANNTPQWTVRRVIRGGSVQKDARAPDMTREPALHA